MTMNPPFTRHERLPKKYKAILEKKFYSYRNYLDGRLGLHGYFILQADRFLKENGKIAFVLPATTSRLQSFEGIKRLLNNRYWIKFIVINGGRSAFSESTSFREILLVAKKGKREGKTTIVRLEKLPTDNENARELSDLILSKGGDNNLTFWEVDQEVALERINSFLGGESQIVEKFNFIAMKAQDKLIKFSDFLRKNDLKTLRGFEMLKKGKSVATKLFIVNDLGRASKQKDEWYLVGELEDEIEVKNRFNNQSLMVPKSSLKPSLRRLSGVGKLDITGETDWILYHGFPEFQTFTDQIGISDLLAMEKDLVPRETNFVFARRFNITAPGTMSIAYFSSVKFAPSKLFWLVTGLHNVDAKILTLFWNSTFNILQVLLNKTETEGGFIEVSDYRFGDFLTINLDNVSSNER